jgi:hypothetical protein
VPDSGTNVKFRDLLTQDTIDNEPSLDAEKRWLHSTLCMKVFPMLIWHKRLQTAARSPGFPTAFRFNHQIEM